MLRAKVETQNLASHKWVRPLLPMPYLYVFVAVCRT